MLTKTIRAHVTLGCILLTATLAGCGSHGISGEYLRETPKEVDLLQITQKGAHDVHGSVIETDYTNNYQVEQSSTAFTGSVNDKQLALNMGLGGISGEVNGDTIALTEPGFLFSAPTKMVFKRSSQSAYDRIAARMKAQASKLAAAATAKEKQRAAQFAENETISTQASNLSYFLVRDNGPASAVNDDLAREQSIVKAARSYVSGGFYFIPENIPSAAAAKSYYRSAFAKDQAQLTVDVSKLQTELSGWDAKVAASLCNQHADEYSNCKAELDAAAKYKLTSEQAKADATKAESESKQLAITLASVLKRDRPRRR